MKDYTIVANNKNKTKITFAYDHGLPYKDRIRPALEYGEWKKYPSKALIKINFNDEEMSFFEQKNQIKNSAIYEIGNEFWLDLNDVYLIIPKNNYLEQILQTEISSINEIQEAEEVVEVEDKNENQNDEGLIQFLAKRNQVTPDRIEKLLKDQVDSWNSTLYSGQPLLIDGLGEFDQQDFKFSGYRIESENSDFFGLEEINITDVQKSSKYKTPKGNIPKDTNKTVSVLLWIFLLVIPVLGLLYFGYTQQELIFGKKSFDDLVVKNSTHRIDTKEKIDTLKVEPKKDSLQKDSLTSPIPTTTTKKPSQNGK